MYNKYHCKCGNVTSHHVKAVFCSKCGTYTEYTDDDENKDIKKMIIVPLRRIGHGCDYHFNDHPEMLKLNIKGHVDVQGFIPIDLLREGIIKYSSPEYNDYDCYNSATYFECLKTFDKVEEQLFKILSKPRLQKDYKRYAKEVYYFVDLLKNQFMDISEKRYYLKTLKEIGNIDNRDTILKAFLMHDVMTYYDLEEYAGIQFTEAMDVISFLVKTGAHAGEYGFPLYLEELKWDEYHVRTTLQFKHFLTWYFNTQKIINMNDEGE